MSAQQSASGHKEFAQVLFVHFAQWAGPHFWDWQALANKAFDAAEQFEVVAIQRHNPQSAVPVNEPPPATEQTLSQSQSLAGPAQPA